MADSLANMSTEDVHQRCRDILGSHWRAPGFSVPNAQIYPWQWLWDSCFHAMVWAELGDPERALTELTNALASQDPISGFVPHVTYWGDPGFLGDFWGRTHTSCITQPPMYGHALAELVQGEVVVPAELVDQAAAGLGFLLRSRRRSEHGLVEVVHPWETGADDSPRWDALIPAPYDLAAWRRRKGDLVSSIAFSPSAAPSFNDECAIGSVGFSALIAFNAIELCAIRPDERLMREALELAQAIGRRWDAALGTWVDDGPTATTSGRIRTLDAMVAALVDPDRSHVETAIDQLVDPGAFGGQFGPTGVHRQEPTFDPTVYWRGPAWPQLSYLCWVAAVRAGRLAIAHQLARSMLAGASISSWAEYWNPDTGAGGGAAPQSWTTLAVLVGNE